MYNWRLLLIKEFLQHSSPDCLVFVIILPFSRARSGFSSSLRNIMKHVSGENKFCRRMFSSSNCLLTSGLGKFLPSFFLPWTFIVYFTLTILFLYFSIEDPRILPWLLDLNAQKVTFSSKQMSLFEVESESWFFDISTTSCISVNTVEVCFAADVW